MAFTARTAFRSFLVLALAALTVLLAGCNRTDNAAAPSFRGLDLTGAPYGRGFRLTDPEGRERTLGDYKGKAVLMYFGFTQCPDVCPTALIRAAEVKKLLGADGEKLQVIFITIDPERDTPEVIKAYTAAFDPSFIGLYGDAKAHARDGRRVQGVLQGRADRQLLHHGPLGALLRFRPPGPTAAGHAP